MIDQQNIQEHSELTPDLIAAGSELLESFKAMLIYTQEILRFDDPLNVRARQAIERFVAISERNRTKFERRSNEHEHTRCNANEPAFPIVRTKHNKANHTPEYFNVHSAGGLTKRELFAAMAIQGLLAKRVDSSVGTALFAVELADALLAELSK